MRLFVQGAQSRQAARADVRRSKLISELRASPDFDAVKVWKSYGLSGALMATRFERERKERQKRDDLLELKVFDWEQVFRKEYGRNPNKIELRKGYQFARSQVHFPRTKWEFADATKPE